MSSFGSRLGEAFARHGQMCVGIDPSIEQLVSWGLVESAEGARQFALEVINACVGQVAIVKPQVAFFEQFGPSGLSVLSEVLVAAKAAGLLVIADAKRGDIGSSMAGYTRAWLSSEAAFQADALTLSPYLGLDSLVPAIEVAMENNKGVFVLSATSNPEAAVIQGATNAAVSVAGLVASFAASFNRRELGSVGVVLGATVSLSDFGLGVGSFPSTPILMPGFGAQGVELSSTRKIFGDLTPNLVCSVSRSVAGVSSSGLSNRILAAKEELIRGVR